MIVSENDESLTKTCFYQVDHEENPITAIIFQFHTI
ncbi:hypothetical protein AALP_AAs41313U000100 [Arabis alpina]|uniref:Uncharacterized protein n=1 Tax=Arabis alpina TaxID=50452 RepID=A0A087G3W1_ARAAL|nr:hypothetical protein AALP_AAs41313U000100 [Arabis alpina]